MIMVYAGGAAGGVTAAIIAAQHNAIKAMGSFVIVEEQEFLKVLEKEENPAVVYCEAGFFSKNKYLTSYKGFLFFTKSKEFLPLPASVEIILAKKISVPEL